MRRYLVPGAAAALLGVAAIVAVLRGGAPSGPVQRLAGERLERTFAPRLSIPTEHRPCTMRPSPDSGTVAREECGPRPEAPRYLYALGAAGESADPDSLQASALAAMVWPDEKQEEASLNAAIDRLNRAWRVSTKPVPLLVDLSAAHLVRAERTQNARDLMAAIEFAYQALAREPGNGSARFNVALALQKFGLDQQAAAEWKVFLSTDSTSPWAREARSRMQDLITRPVPLAKPRVGASSEVVKAFAEQHPQEARELGMDSILGEWGAAVEQGQQLRADSLLSFADSLGAALASREGGDRSLADLVRDIRAARSDARATAVLARAHQDYAEGRAHFARYEGEAAIDAFMRVINARPRSAVLLQWAEILRASAPLYTTRPERALPLLRARLPDANGDHYPALAGRARQALGNILARGQQVRRGLELLREAARYLARAGEGETLAKTLSTDAETVYALGDTVEAYRIMHRAIQMSRGNPRHAALLAFGRFAEEDEMAYAAWAIYNEDIGTTEHSRASIDAVESHIARSRVRKLVSDTWGARTDLASADAYIKVLPPEPRQKEYSQQLHRMNRLEGVTAAQMDSAVNTFSDNAIWQVRALIRRAELRLAEDDVDGATADLRRLADGVRNLTEQQANAALRTAIKEQARSIFDRLVMVHAGSGRPDEALRALEAGRMSFTSAGEGEVRPGEGRLAAPPGQVAIEYGLIGDTLLTWMVGDSIRLWRQSVDRARFLRAVERAGVALESARAPVPRDDLRRLYNWLIRPIRPYLGRPGMPLVILADGEVAAVPFAALMDGDRYLIEDYPLRFASTLADAARPARRGTGPALLVANPAFDEDEYELGRLPGASDEVQSLARLYRQRVLLEDSSATRKAFVDSARRASVIHYAGHAVFDDARPERSYLLLAGSDTTGRLTAEGVAGMRLDGSPLVVLSACRTLRSRAGRSGGFVGLSGALLNAGADGVVGSLWDVNDQRVQPLMEAFHRQYRDGKNPAQALREAQLEMLRSEDRDRSSPAVWAGFRYTGG